MKLRPGLSLIELLIALAIVGMLMASIIPMLGQREPGHERKKFTARLNALMHTAWEQSVISNKVHRVLFDFQQRKAFVERDMTQSPEGKALEFEKVKGISAEMDWPKNFEIRQFIVEGFDEMKRFGGRKGAETSWYYIIPNGMTQQVTINGVDKEEIIRGKPSPFGLVLNPYMAQFKAYDEYQK